MQRRGLGLLGVLCLVTACPDDGTPVTTEADSSSSGGESSTTAPPTTTATTTLDPTGETSSADTTTLDTLDPDSSSSESSSEGESSSSSGVVDLCGNDMIDAGEICDGTDLGGSDCVMQGYDGGTLGCAANCNAFDETACTMADCGNGTLEGRELCDGADLGGATCVSEGFDGGTLACSPTCMVYNFASCSNCGDNDQDGDEACDGTDFGGETCLSQGFQGGELSCTADCATLVTDGCNDEPPCAEEDIGSAVGQGVASGNTAMDDDDLDQVCASGGGNDHIIRWVAPADGTYRFDTVDSGYDTSLALYTDCVTPEFACNDDLGFDANRDSRIVTDVSAGDLVLISVSGFGAATGNWVLNINLDGPGGPCCSPHGSYGCDSDDGSCDDTVCAIDPDCCNPAALWSAECVALAVANCASCQGVCGNGAVDDDAEVCDGADLDAQTCITQGFDYGTISCEGDCTFDTSLCGNYEGDCCSDNGAGSPGCGDHDCNVIVCGEDPTCCGDTWDAACATLASTECAVCNPDACGNNLIDGAGEVCDGIDLGGDDCVSQGFLYGELACADDCSALDVSDCNDFGDCVEDNLGSAVGNGVATGTTVGEDEDLLQTCGGSGAVDFVLAWTAPAAGTYRFDTVDSAYDTVLSLHSACGGAATDCNDDVGFNSLRDSRIVTDVAAGELVFIAVSGFSGVTGTWVLNINLDVPGTGDCCVPHGTYSCDSEAGCSAAVCAISADCCNIAAPWTQACVDIAETSCASCM